MSVRFTQDIAPLDDLELALANPEKVLEDISVALAEQALSQVRDGFKSATDPYGQGWAPKKRGDGRAILVGKTADLQGSWNRKTANAAGFEIESGKDYAIYHQGGTKKMVARKMVPNKGDIPDAWKKDFDEAVADIFDELFG